jgi:hypothetical protein
MKMKTVTKAQARKIQSLFEDRYKKSDDKDGCWLWVGPRQGDSYPTFYHNSVFYSVRNLAWFYAFDEFPPAQLYVSCRNGMCVNPLHLSDTHPKFSPDLKIINVPLNKQDPDKHKNTPKNSSIKKDKHKPIHKPQKIKSSYLRNIWRAIWGL